MSKGERCCVTWLSSKSEINVLGSGRAYIFNVHQSQSTTAHKSIRHQTSLEFAGLLFLVGCLFGVRLGKIWLSYKDVFFTGSQTDDVSVNWISVLLPGLTFLLKLKHYLKIAAALDFGVFTGKYSKGRWEETWVGQGERGHEEEKRGQWQHVEWDIFPL